MGIYSLSVQTSCTCGTLKLKRFAKTFSSYLFIPCSVLWLSGTDLMTYFLYWKGWLSQGFLHWDAFIYLSIYLFFIASDDKFSSLTSRPVSNVVLLPCRTKLIELNSTLARQQRDVWNQVELLPCSTASFAVLHGISSTWFQTSRCYRAELNS